MLRFPAGRRYIGLWTTLAGIVLVLAVQAYAETVRKPAVAGMFYPEDPRALADMIESLVDQAGKSGPEPERDRPLRALVMPHAGYAYSGLTAAHGVVALEGRDFSKIVIIAPDHRVGFKGGAITDADAYQTPLGNVPIHRAADRLREKYDFFRAIAASDAREHAVEVILPFLQARLSDFSIIPIVLGSGDLADACTAAVETVLDPSTLIVVSTDLSHYLPYDKAVERDRKTVGMITRLQTDKLAADPHRACGWMPLLVLMELAEKRGWQPELLHYANSGDTAGGRGRVVGYATIAFYGEKTMSANNASQPISREKGEVLLAVARKSIADRLGIRFDIPPELHAGTDDPVFQSARGTFVTLKINGRLRGCIGNLVAEKPLIKGVRDNAVNAAFHDPRFAPLSPAEFDKIQIEVSLLTEPQPLQYTDARDLLDKIRPHEDGLIIKKGPYSATFLPQVWEQVPDKKMFLQHLCMKAGLPADAWEKGGLEVLTYQVQYFEEPS